MVWLVALSLACALPLTVVGGELIVDPASPNVIDFPAQEAKFVRFVIREAAGAPCIDELEVYEPDSDKNLALAENGAKASASSCLPGYAIHQIPHLNDGRYGNSFSWIAASSSNEWAQIELPKPARIDRVVFSRDRKGRYRDRLPTTFEVQISSDGRDWHTVKKVGKTHIVSVEERLLLPNKAISLDFPEQRVKFVRLVIRKTNNGSPPCVDELEVYGSDPKKNLASASAGATASASSSLKGHAIHKIEHLNDGKYTNAHSWIAEAVSSWTQVELVQPTTVQRVVFSRDRGGTYKDRLPTDFEIRTSQDGRQWTPVKKVIALRNVTIDKPVAGESPTDWAYRIASTISDNLRKAANELLSKIETEDDVRPMLDLLQLDRQRKAMEKRLTVEFNPAAIRRAVADLKSSFPARYKLPPDFEKQLSIHEKLLPELLRHLSEGDADQVKQAMTACEGIIASQRAALLSNPLLNFDEILVLKRRTPGSKRGHVYWQWGQKYGMTVNWSCDFRPKNPPVAPWWKDELVAFSLKEERNAFRTIFRPKAGLMIQHPELHFDAGRMLFTMPGSKGAFQVFEVGLDGTGLRQITNDTGPDVDNGDPVYLPDGRIIFNSTRGFQAVPCEDGNSYVSNLCITNARGMSTRMLTFDQESNWYPTLLNNGRVLYTRYEYANVSHQFGRLLFHMNPDGTGQTEYYGSNSYWPNSVFYARPIPGHPTMVIGVVCGHHGPNRTGRLVLFDPARGRRETEGAVQTIPGYGKKVERIVQDVLYGNDWPKFAHPWPLSDKYFLVSARLHPEQVEYGLYLVDIFDNITEICRLQDYSLFEPLPLRKRKAPPAIADRVKPKEKEATVVLTDVYQGPGLQGVPRGAVKKLRLFSYNFMYRDTRRRGFGHLATPGVDGPWEPRYILGTVPVAADGSALFKVPANTPISVQPLDEEGRALQVMRSWFTAMPGEVMSCVGCHQPQNAAPAAKTSILPGKADSIKPWRGPPRGFDFELEVQPVLDKFCVGCHSGKQPGRPDFARKSEKEKLRINTEYHRKTQSSIRTIFTPSFIALHPYVRRPHAESNYSTQAAGEYYADTSALVQLLKKGHHNVKLDEESWDRLYTWIDLGAPDHGSWKNSEWGAPGNYYERRLEMLKRFANRTDDVEWLPPASEKIPGYIQPPAEEKAIARIDCPNWPFDAAEARRRQESAGLPETVSLSLTDSRRMEFVLIPPGEFPMGTSDGPADERPVARARIGKPFYMSCHEVTNEQFRALVDPNHNSGHVAWRSIDWRGEGYPLSGATQPVVRVSYRQAMEFCRALSVSSEKTIRLPTEAQWEWACRAGSDKPMWYGTADDDFSKVENLAGREQRRFAFSGKRKWYLRDDRFDDGSMITAPVGSYRPNPWGLHDMHGNVCEWTRSAYHPHPNGRRDNSRQKAEPDRVIRGGSWSARPARARSTFRWKYPTWMKVHNVGFRVIIEAE